MKIDHIRNFSIIAHIDHGKSTLADTLLESTHTVPERKMKEQFLDKMDLERERGITIKAKAVRMYYQAENGEAYLLNLIDTPGHVDFTYEVSRSLAACEGTILVVDASQGVEAQTLANVMLAKQNNLVIIPVINKIDLPNADPERVKNQIQDILKVDTSDIILASAKNRVGTKEILEAIVAKVPSPTGSQDKPLCALIFDCNYDPYRGAIIYVRVVDGSIKKDKKIKMFSNNAEYEVDEIGFLRPEMEPAEELVAGEVGYIIAGIKNLQDVKIGDTVTMVDRPTETPFHGFKELKPMVYAGFFPVNPGDYNLLLTALEKLRLNDTSFVYSPESSVALGFGFRCGFLGLLHMDIIKERLTREYSLELIITSPNVIYQIFKTNEDIVEIDSPVKFPPPQEIAEINEPYIKGMVITPSEFVGNVMQLSQEKRGIFKNMHYLDTQTVVLNYELPLAEIIMDFYDKLKSATRGYASFDYEYIGYRPTDLVKLEIMINHEPVDAFSFIVPREKAPYQGKRIVTKLRKLIPRQMFEIPIQASIDNKIIARENISALRKDVIAKCYGGDISRKRKLLEKQREGKKKMKQIGSVEIPQKAFLSVLSIDED
ncbi:MAG: translation elongation factor 4 [bacterium]|nr:translation elongation factor 4 [bacterium]